MPKPSIAYWPLCVQTCFSPATTSIGAMPECRSTASRGWSRRGLSWWTFRDRRVRKPTGFGLLPRGFGGHSPSRQSVDCWLQLRDFELRHSRQRGDWPWRLPLAGGRVLVQGFLPSSEILLRTSLTAAGRERLQYRPSNRSANPEHASEIVRCLPGIVTVALEGVDSFSSIDPCEK